MDPGGTWTLIDQRASMRKQGLLTQRENRHITRRVDAALREDRKERALQAGHAVMGHLASDDARQAWGALRAWHKECDPAASKPCYHALEE